MAWSDLSVDKSLVEGLAQDLLTDRTDGSFDPSRITPARSDSSRGLLEDVLFNDGDLARFITNAGSRSQLLDDIQGNAELQTSLKRGHALAFLVQYGDDSSIFPGGRRAELSDTFEERLRGWAEGFGRVAAEELGYTSTTASTGGGAFASTMHAYD